MRISKILTFFSVISSTLSTHLLMKYSVDSEKFVKDICKITNDAVNTKSDTQDILIGNLNSKVWSSTVNDIVRCIDNENLVVLTDFKALITEKNLRKASVVILALNWNGMNTIRTIVKNHHFSTVWHFMPKIICILPGSVHTSQSLQILQIFTQFGFYNVAIAVRSEKHGAQYLIVKSSLMNVGFVINPLNAYRVFPDKLKDMKGFSYQIPIYHQPPRVLIGNHTTSPMLFLLEALKNVQKSDYQLIALQNYSMLIEFWLKRRMHLTLNTATIINTPEPKLMTYEETGYCALVPIPPKVSLVQLIFVKPFDGLTWMFLLLSIIASAVIWSMFRNLGAVDSPWLLAYGIFVYFIGQGVDFSRRNRLVLTILIQLIVLMIWVLSNAYEGVITSFMIDPIHENRLKTVEDLLASDYEILTDEAFAFTIRDYDNLQAIKSRMNIFGSEMEEHYKDLIRLHKNILILSCEMAEHALGYRLKNQRYIADYYYVLPEKITTQYIELEASYMNPFLERFQYYMDWSFQAGLPYIWKIFTNQFSIIKPENALKDDVAYIELKDLYQVFSLLVIGYALSILVFLMEIFFHDFLKDLNLRFLARQLRNRVNKMAYKKRIPKDPKYQRGALYYIIHRRKKVKRLQRRRIKVRRMFIQPRNIDV